MGCPMMPSPTKPTSMPFSPWRRPAPPHSFSPALAVRAIPPPAQPRQPLLGAPEGAVLATHPAAVAEAVERPQEGGEVGLAGPGLVTARMVGDLYVADARQEPLQDGAQVLAHGPGVVGVQLQEEGLRAHLVQDPRRLGGTVEPEARHVAGVHGLHVEAQAGLAQAGEIGR